MLLLNILGRCSGGGGENNNNNNKPLEPVQVNKIGPGREQANAEGSGLGRVGVFEVTRGGFPRHPTDIYLNNVQIHSQASGARVQWVGR